MGLPLTMRRGEHATSWLDELPRDERELWLEAIRAAGPVPHDPPARPGDWIPFGHIPIELIPEPDVGPLHATTGLASSPGAGKWGKGRRRRRAWHAL